MDPLEHQLEDEIAAIEEFLNLADDIGLLIPGDGPHLRALRHRSRRARMAIDTGTWPDDDVLEVAALAQHHGVPTRLLDFSKHPLIALHFAAQDALASGQVKRDPGSRLAVWAVNTTELLEFAKGTVDDGNYDPRFEVVEIPRHSNHYLHAQQGVFLNFRGANRWYERNESWPRFERVIAGWYSRHREDADLDSILRKVTMPVAEVPELLRLLAHERITLAHLMPTYDNVVKTIRQYRSLGISWWKL